MGDGYAKRRVRLHVDGCHVRAPTHQWLQQREAARPNVVRAASGGVKRRHRGEGFGGVGAAVSDDSVVDASRPMEPASTWHPSE
ncbi:hypothetical protein GUJ93_ZPchr0007g5747 [Zizania palustris]|uniref:Uncharacterized protein n=1 Tax=Zizania palustris TaxID=103762 RepID=A0A8J5TIW0_ZIZPA|nr:hypothetical protein GUJ93_ZPchr0007g5747 [Zizania palustris]